MKYLNNEEWDKFVEELMKDYPEEMEAAGVWAKEYLDKVRSGEIELDIKPFPFSEED